MAYGDLFSYMDRALNSEHGIQIDCGSQKDATTLRLRCYKAIHSDRKQNAAQGLGLFSDYDDLMFRVEGQHLRIEKPGQFPVELL